MKFNISYDPNTVNATSLGSAGNLSAFEAQVNAAAQLFSATFLDPVTVNIIVKYGAVGTGQSEQSLYAYPLSDAKDALAKDITSIDDLKTANAAGGGGTVYLTQTQLKALGLIPADAPGPDGTITFDNRPGLMDFTHSSTMSSSSYDLFGVASHEISEIMGRVADLTAAVGGTTLPTILSQSNAGGNFTVGSETLLEFNTAATGDRGDWDSSVSANDAFRAFASPGKVADVSATDLRVLDVIGWDRKAAASVSVAENKTAVTTVTAQDADARQSLIFSIDGGGDAAKSAIGLNTANITFLTAPDLEPPTDTSLDGFDSYHVNAEVSDGAGDIETQVSGAGKNIINGCNGADMLVGELGEDTLTGGSGPDVFAFATSFGKDILADFMPMLDSIQFDRTVFANFGAGPANTADVADTTVINYGANDAITLQGLTRSQSSAGDFQFV